MNGDIGKNDCYAFIIVKQGEGTMKDFILFDLKISIIMSRKRQSHTKGQRYNITIAQFNSRSCNGLVCLTCPKSWQPQDARTQVVLVFAMQFHVRKRENNHQ